MAHILNVRGSRGLKDGFDTDMVISLGMSVVGNQV